MPPNNVKLNLYNVLGLLSLISPFLLPFLLVTISIINGDLKGSVYLFGLVCVFVIILLFQTTIRDPVNPQAGAAGVVGPVEASPLFYVCGIFDSNMY